MQPTETHKNSNQKPSRSVLSLIDELTRELARLRAATQVITESRRVPPSPMATSKVAQDLHDHPGSTRQAVARRTKLHPRTAGKAMHALVERGLAVRVGDRRGTRWFLSSTLEAMRHTEH